MASVRSLMQCIGADTSGSSSVLRDFFGFLRARVPTDPDTTVTAEVSLLDQVRGVQGRHVHLNVIQVGFDLVTDLDGAWEMLDYCVYRTRAIYRTRSLGVGRVLHFEVVSAEAQGFDDIGSRDEAQDLWQSFDVDNNGIDVFVTRANSSPILGRSPVDGDCDKDGNDDGLWGGDLNRTFDGLSRTFAHEIGHYLSLEHNHGNNNCPTTTAGRNRLMAQTGCAISVRTSVNLTSGEGSDARSHCIVRSGC
ncbi:MAG: hypothetical protein R3E98_08830 [Gemmatimonadota bacterium]